MRAWCLGVRMDECPPVDVIDVALAARLDKAHRHHWLPFPLVIAEAPLFQMVLLDHGDYLC
jgi:hypothetical protein